MKRFYPAIYISLALLGAASFSACIIAFDDDNNNNIDVRGSGRVVDEARPISNVHGVVLATIGTLSIEQGNREHLRIEAEDNLLRYLETRVRGGTLHIEVDNDVDLRPTEPIRYYLTVRSLDEVVLAGSGTVLAPDLTTENLILVLAGSGEIEVQNLDAGELTVELAGSGTVYASGAVEQQEVVISGSGVYEARDLTSDEANVVIAGSGTVYVHVIDELVATISGSGSIYYKGTPQVTQVVTGSGRITPLRD